MREKEGGRVPGPKPVEKGARNSYLKVSPSRPSRQSHLRYTKPPVIWYNPTNLPPRTNTLPWFFTPVNNHHSCVEEYIRKAPKTTQIRNKGKPAIGSKPLPNLNAFTPFIS